MKRLSGLCLATAIWVLAAPALAAPQAIRQVFVPLSAEPARPDQMQARKVVLGEVFLVQQLSAADSVTLQADVRVPVALGSVVLPKGEQLILAKARDGSGNLYCGAYAATVILGNPNQGRQWFCFDDSDGDGVFETAYVAPFNSGAFLPAFDRVTSPRNVSAPYVRDPEAGRYGFETGFFYQSTKARSGIGDIVEKVRGAGDAQWSDVLGGDVTSRTGYSTWISGQDFPEEVTLDRAQFTVVGGDKTGLTIQPRSVATEDLGFVVRRCRGFGLNCGR